MNVAGVDCGAKFIKALILQDGKILAKSAVLSGFDQKAAAPALQSDSVQAKDSSLPAASLVTPRPTHQLAASSCVQKWFARVITQSGHQ